MGSRRESALKLAERGFYVFPVVEGSKLPAIKDWPNAATRDPEQIAKWWETRDYNIGISTSRYGDHQALVTIDVDNKGDKHGDAAILELELQGLELPVSFEQSTPSGGRHVIYVADAALKQGVNVLGRGLDIRSSGGYIVGPGSEIGGARYEQINGHGVLAQAPGWLVDRLGQHVPVERDHRGGLAGVDGDRARDRGLAYLKTAPRASEGNGGDTLTFKVAARLKDLGCSQDQALQLLLDHWNDECLPPWEHDDIAKKVANAYGYGREPIGSAAPEANLPMAVAESDIDHPRDKLNREYAFVQAGGHVVHETTDDRGRFKLAHISLGEFHSWFANKTIQVGDKTKPLSEVWMSWSGRREYESFVFAPEREVGPRFYNLWHGFSVKPANTADHPMVKRFLEHALENVCGGDNFLFHWLIGYFAHMIQRPWEKPLVALVFKGKKGTGKNALLERICYLLGRHALVTAKRRYLTGNFNGHFENCLLFVGDELYWAGDKQAEGELKDLITGKEHVIEHKGQAPYVVDNLTRVAIIGNESWLVPASADERRFAVFEVGDGRIQDRRYFEELRLGLDRDGGAAHLLRYLLDFDLSTVDVNAAPNTRGLSNQKVESLVGVDLFWHDCADTAEVSGCHWLNEGIRVGRATLYQSYEKQHKGNRNKYPHRSEKAFWKETFALLPQISNKDARLDGYRAIDLPGLVEARAWLADKLKVLNEWTEKS